MLKALVVLVMLIATICGSYGDDTKRADLVPGLTAKNCQCVLSSELAYTIRMLANIHKCIVSTNFYSWFCVLSDVNQ